MDALIGLIANNMPAALQAAVLVLLCGWVWKANGTLIELRACIKSVREALKAHDEWERELRERELRERGR